MIDHAKNARKFNMDPTHVAWHNLALWHVREKRDQARNEVDDWENLRDQASGIKEHTLDHLHHYLIEFEKKLIENGWIVHWASDAGKHNQLVYSILSEKKIDSVVKSKSMLTEECGLNEYLGGKGIEIIDTDLGERIVQLANTSPSHIVLPAIHMRKREISQLFHRHYGTDAAIEDPEYLTGIVRTSLRHYLTQTRAAISGVNFGLAYSGAVVVCTNEGNADMGIHHSDLYIASMGIEKLIPGKKELSVFLRLLARSATGQSITTYTSHLIKPPPGKEYHIILVDNGRTGILANPKYKEVLKCIRCGACMNTCPVYRRSGGYSYGYIIPGPIGSILAPLKNIKTYHSLPFASSLCGSCSDICPVKINIHELLYRLRADAVSKNSLSISKKVQLTILDKILYHRFLYTVLSYAVIRILRFLPRFFIYNRFNAWGKSREVPEGPIRSFKSWYKKEIRHG